MSCIPYDGDLDDQWRPITKTGELFMPGPRSCKHKDCINPEHVGKEPQICKEPNCGQKLYSLSLCSRHFYALKRGKERVFNKQNVLKEIIDTWDATQEPPELCSYEDCTRPYKAKGLCLTHYLSHYQYLRRLAMKQSTDLQ
jgi:hypothetical protein